MKQAPHDSTHGELSRMARRLRSCSAALLCRFRRVGEGGRVDGPKMRERPVARRLDFSPSLNPPSPPSESGTAAPHYKNASAKPDQSSTRRLPDNECL